MRDNTPAKTATFHIPFRIRPRTQADLDACVRVLATVHEQHGYPLN